MLLPISTRQQFKEISKCQIPSQRDVPSSVNCNSLKLFQTNIPGCYAHCIVINRKNINTGTKYFCIPLITRTQFHHMLPYQVYYLLRKSNVEFFFYFQNQMQNFLYDSLTLKCTFKSCLFIQKTLQGERRFRTLSYLSLAMMMNSSSQHP